MKDIENIDKLFSSSMENFEITPPAEAKIAIEKQLYQIAGKKNNRKKGGWLLLFITSFSIFATAMFVQTQQKNTPVISQKQIESVTKNAFEASASNNNVIDKNILNSKKASTTNNTKTESNSLIESQKTYQYSWSNKNSDSNEKSQNKNNIKRSKNQLNEVSNFKNALSENLIKKAALHESNLNQKEAITPINADENTNADFIKNEVLTSISTNINNDEIDLKNDRLSDSALSQTPEAVVPIKIEEPKTKTQHGFIGMLVGSGLNSNYFNSSNLIARQELKDSIQFSKPYLSAQFTGGVYYKGWEISSGMGIMQQNEKVKYSYVFQEKTQILVDSIYIDPISHDTIVKHNVPVDTLMKKYKSNQELSHYTYLQIPILIGYRLPIRMKWLIDFKIGGLVNMLLKSKGNYKSTYVGSIEDYKTKSDAPFRNINFNAIATFGINYQLSEKTMLQVSFPFQLGLGNVYKKDYFINKSVNSVGAQLGIKYDL